MGVVLLAAAGCSSGAGEASTTTVATVRVPVAVVAHGRGVTWSELGLTRCDVGDVRVKVAVDGDTVALETLALEGGQDVTGQVCTTDPGFVEVPADADFLSFTISGEGPLGAAWVSPGEFTLAEAQAGVTARARA